MGPTCARTNWQEAGAAAGYVRAEPCPHAFPHLSRHRHSGAHSAEHHPLEPAQTVGIGFCFGGGALLEYVRTGSTDLDGVVSFHGDLLSPTLAADADKVRTPMLILHGAADPYVPQGDVQRFISAMQKGQVDDWQLVQSAAPVPLHRSDCRF